MRSVTLGFISMLHVSIALAVWRARPGNLVNRLFALQTLAFAGWTLGNAILQTGTGLNTGAVLSFASASLIPSALLTFTIHYPSPTRTLAAAWQWPALLVGGLFAVASLTTDWLVYDVRPDPLGLSRKPGLLYPWFIAYFVLVTCAALIVYVRKSRRARGRERAQLDYYGLGLVIASVGGTTSNLFIPALTGSSSVSHIGPCFGLALIILTAHAIIRHRFMDLRVVVHRSLAFAIALLASLVPAAALFILAVHPMLTDLTSREAILAGAVFLGVGLTIPFTRDLAEWMLNRYMYRARTDPQQLLRQASTELTHALDPTRLLQVMMDTIRAAVEPEGVATYLEREGAIRLCAVRVLDSRTAFTAVDEPEASILAAIEARRKPLLRDDLDAPADADLRDGLSETWALVLPLMADEKLVGLVAVGPKRSGDPFFSHDVDALATLANHAGSAVKNATLYAQVVLANEYVNNIVGAMQNGVIAVDTRGCVSLINPAARDVLGGMSSAMLSIDLIPGPLQAILMDVLADGRQRTAREMTLSESETTRPLSILCTASPLHNPAGQRVGAVAVFSDMTPLKELEHQRTRAESLASLQRVTQALAHEIGNPLVPIKALTKLLPSRVGDQKFAQDLSRIVARELERIERLVARLRRVAPSEEPSYARIDLCLSLRHALEVLEAAAAEQDTRLETALPPCPVPIIGDSAELEELFLNLLTNALEAVAEQPVGSREVHISIVLQASGAVVQICDSGKGIPLDVVNRLFDPFITTKPRGSGLGLAICAGIVERHHGHLAAANANGGGAVFTTTIPLAQEVSGAPIS